MDANGWVQCTDDKCPIPWAKKGEYEVVWNGVVQSWPLSFDAHLVTWYESFKWRLTDRWIPVLGGMCPEQIRGAKADEWEWLYRDSSTPIRANYAPIDIGNPKKFWGAMGMGSDIVAVRLIKQIPDELKDGLRKASEKSVDLARQLIENQRKLAQPKQETLKQRLTREAWVRYKAKHPDPIPFHPLGEDEMNDIAAAALREHDRVWPVRK